VDCCANANSIQGTDPTGGFVNYLSQAEAQESGLFSTQNGTIYIGVDSSTVSPNSGRNSVRITSLRSYNQGLIILDASHVPGGECGTWPSFWMVGPNWPANGELDIIEGINSATTNTLTLHTNGSCFIANTNFTGTLVTSNCDINAVGQATNQGCSIETTDSTTYGTGFNDGGGGIYATEWTSDAITIWFFPRSEIPVDLSNDTPDPTTWGPALASFSGECNIGNYVRNMQIVIDTTFCGSWAGASWSTDQICSQKAPTCESFVQNNPSAFTDAYWSINHLRVYQDSSTNGASSSTATNPPTLSTASSKLSITSSFLPPYFTYSTIFPNSIIHTHPYRPTEYSPPWIE
jgi:Glycosyl hydrolases family 16